MEPELSKYLNSLEKGEKISLVLSGIIVDGTLDEIVDNCVVLTDATSPGKKKQYRLIIPLENIYAWGHKQKKKVK
jgi:ferredoxin-fold anticodon binding domain-containing protein